MANLNDLMQKDIFELLNISKIPQEEKDKLLEKFTNTIQARVTIRIANLLSEAEAQKFSQLAEANDQEGMRQFMSDHHIDVQKLTMEEAMRYRIELVEMLDSTVATTGE